MSERPINLASYEENDPDKNLLFPVEGQLRGGLSLTRRPGQSILVGKGLKMVLKAITLLETVRKDGLVQRGRATVEFSGTLAGKQISKRNYEINYEEPFNLRNSAVYIKLYAGRSKYQTVFLISAPKSIDIVRGELLDRRAKSPVGWPYPTSFSKNI